MSLTKARLRRFAIWLVIAITTGAQNLTTWAIATVRENPSIVRPTLLSITTALALNVTTDTLDLVSTIIIVIAGPVSGATVWPAVTPVSKQEAVKPDVRS